MLSYKKKDNKFNNKRTMNNNGFTLVEMIVTFVVLGILMAISVMSLMAWQDWADFNRQNEYAETLFLSAQNQLSEYSANGTLGEFSKRAYEEEHNNKVDLNSIYYAEGETFTSELKKENSVWTSKEAGTLCYAMAFKGDYAKYMAGEETSSPTADIVFELVEEYVYDTSILNETICIEFSLEDGQVFSAFYTDKFTNQDDTEYEAFEYNNNNEALRGLVNIATRYESYRKDRMVGYYGVDTLSAALVSKTDKPTISKIYLNNEETLNLSFKLGKYANATNQLTYEIGVVDTKINKKVLNIVLDTSTHPLKNYENREAVPCKVTRYVYDDEGNATSQDLGTLDIIAYLDKDNQVRVVLDAVDAQATTYLYKKNTASLADADSIKNNNVPFANTFSFHRFGLNTEDIYCTLQGYGVMYKATSAKQSNSSNVYFATGKNEENNTGKKYTYEYTIKNARHLSNIRYIEDIDESNLAAYKGIDNTEDIYITYVVADDINWKNFVESDNYYLSNASNIKLPSEFYDARNVDIVTNTSFASFDRLRMNDKLTGGSEYKISGLNISVAFNSLCGLYGYSENGDNNNGLSLNTAGTNNEEDEKPVGLFNINYGTIERVNLDNIKVKSNDNKVGAFCGINVSGTFSDGAQTGILTNLKVFNSGINTDDASVIIGKEHVGGIVGYLQGVGDDDNSENVDRIELSNLINEAKVTGDKFVGGIVGEVRTSKSKAVKILIQDCKNYGAVIASSVEIDKNGEIQLKSDTKTARYIGGITGYTANVYANTHSDDPDAQTFITISGCESTPVYSDSDLENLFNDIIENSATESSKLNGVYVGGIVGYNYFSTIEDCTTKSSDGRKGYVFGNKYVGGIVGFNQGPTSGINGKEINNNKNGVNEANVVGREYVGGIVGCNADVDEEKIKEDAFNAGISISGKFDNEILEMADFDVSPDNNKNPGNKIENWDNRGVIYATDRYAGGISGYNTGWIYHCNSDVESSNVDTFFKSTCSSGEYAGGIAGYNNGIIGNTERALDANGNFPKVAEGKNLSAECYISGKNYVGGIVGYNDVDAIVENYEVADGTIKGDGSFIGGYAGFNASKWLLINDDTNTARAITSSPHNIVGKYFVGGVVGGNIINISNGEIDKNELGTRFKTDSFQCNVTGKEFVGGFFGYNLLFDSDSITYKGVAKNNPSETIQYGILEELTNQKDDIKENAKVLADLSNKFGGYKTSDVTLYVSGAGKDSDNELLGIVADIYVGGVFGYNDSGTKVIVKDVVNTTPIKANEAIRYNEDEERYDEQHDRNIDYSGQYKEYKYSYAGGITGKVSSNMTIIKCENDAKITTKGTYKGGLAEINEGVIKECKYDSFVSIAGGDADDYVGGICGLNKSEINECSVRNVEGRNVVAGIAAENLETGTIINPYVYTVEDEKNIFDGIVVVRATENDNKDGVCAGIAAYNEGTIRIDIGVPEMNIQSDGNYVGAIIAINNGKGNIENGKLPSDDKDVITSANMIKITGTIEGYKTVGGVIGKNEGKDENIKITGFENNATVTAEKGTAGGIIGDNASGNKITFCNNRGVVTAKNAGDAGGITSTNSSDIIKCNNYAEINAASGMSGGITAINNEGALISYCLVEPEGDNSKLDFVSRDSVGGIAAINDGTIENIEINNVNVYNYTTSGTSNIGIVAGINDEYGKITINDGKAINLCTAKTYTNFSFVGGVVGTNKGTISGGERDENDLPTTIIVPEVGFMDSSVTIATLGGVAGVNYGEITNISVNGKIIGDLGSDDVGYGGIAGINGYLNTTDSEKASKDAVISYCTFDGEVHAEGSGAGIARIGGITGNNAYRGDISFCYLGVLNEGDEYRHITKIYAGEQEEIGEDGNIRLTTDTYQKYDNNQKEYDIILTAYDRMSYAYIGGIAGENYGSVTSCDNYQKTKDIDYSDTVRIYSFTSISGGIVGFARPGSYVSGTKDAHLTTGENWEINARSTDNDRGNGGIVGTYSSYYDLEYLDNYASVTCKYRTNPCVGGLIGFIDQLSVSDLTISNSTNHGNVTSYSRAGGMVALLAYNGIHFKDCSNYGTVRCTGGNINNGKMAGGKAVAGFVEYAMHIGSDIIFENCCNYGSVIMTGGQSAGFISDYGFNAGSLRFIDCVNTGVIGRSIDPKANEISYDADLLTNCAGFSTKGGSYSNCRNYANDTIYGLMPGGTDAYDCLDVSENDLPSNANNPFSPFAKNYGDASRAKNNFYIKKESSDYEQKEQYGVYTSVSSEVLIREEYSNRVKSLYKTPIVRQRYVYNSNGITNISFDFAYDNDSDGIDALVVYFNDNNNTVNDSSCYKYSYTLYDEYGNELDTIPYSDDSYVEVNVENDLELGKTVLDFGAFKGKKVARVILHTANYYNKNNLTNSRFHGFGYIPSGHQDVVADLVPMNDYVKNQTGTSMDITMNNKLYNGNSNNTSGAIDGDSYIMYFADYTNKDGYFLNNYDPSRLVFNITDGGWEECTFGIHYDNDSAKGLGALHLILTTQNGRYNGRSDDYYLYYAEFYDKNGNVYNAGTEDSPYKVEKPVQGQTVTLKVPDDCTEKITQAKVFFKCSRSWINMSGFRWSEKGSDKQLLLPYDDKLMYYNVFQNQVSTELIVMKDTDEEGNDILRLYPSFIDTDKIDDYSIVLKENTDIQSSGYYNDKHGSISEYEEDGSFIGYDRYKDDSYTNDSYEGIKNTRVGVYKELDPSFEEYLYNVAYSPNVKLDPPSNVWISVNNGTNGKYRVTWNKVTNATGYMLHYELIEKSSGKIVYTSEDIEGVTRTDNQCYTDYDAKKISDTFAQKGGTGEFEIHFYVKAVSAHHRNYDRDHEGEVLTEEQKAERDKYDSDYKKCVANGLISLPSPKFHLEYIETNEAVVVIDNFEDYKDIDDYKNAVEIYVSASGKYFGGVNNITVSFKEGRGYSEPFLFTDAVITGNHSMGAYAKPTSEYIEKNIYMNSLSTYTSGALMKSEQHKATLGTGNFITNFKGFYGDTNDSMTYNIELIVNNIDTYSVADIVAMDETLGVPVSYDYGKVHSAAKEGSDGVFTISLSGLPTDLVGREFTVRSYLYATQSYIQYYGHDVAENITLTSNDDVKAVKDEKYFNSEGIIATDTPEGPQSICDDEGKLKPGYVIYDNQDGTYNVYYSASLSLDEQSIESGETPGLYNVHRMTYNPYAEDYNAASGGYGYYTAFDLRETRDIRYTWNYTATRNFYNIASSELALKPSSYAVSGGTYGNNPKYQKYKATYSWEELYEGEKYGYYFLNKINNGNTNKTNETVKSYTTGDIGIPYNGNDAPTMDDVEAFFEENISFTLRRRAQFIQPKPVIKDEYEVETDEYGHSTYIFTWDENLQGELYEDAKYSVILKGTTVNGEVVTLSTPQVTYENKYGFKDEQGNWNYSKFTLEVTRIGTVDENGRAIILPSGSSMDFKCMLKLQKLTKPSATLSAKEGSNLNDGFYYAVDWVGIINTNMRKDLGGYLITVSASEYADENVKAKPHYYYIQSVDSGVEDTIDLDFDSLSLDGKVIDLSRENETYTDRSSYYLPNGDSAHRAYIDLSDFNGGDTLNITVQAIARSHSENYINGLESDAFNITLRNRLATPNLDNLTSEGDYDKVPDNSMSISGINSDGITLTYTDNDGFYTDLGRAYYNIAIAVYDEEGKASQDEDDVAKTGSKAQVAKDGDAPNANAAGYWNSGAIKTLVNKSEYDSSIDSYVSTNMQGGTLDVATYTIKATSAFNLSDYAGKWLKITIRATKSSEINSAWTDEDADDATVNYFWVRIPEAELNSVNLKEGENKAVKYYFDTGNNEWIKMEKDEALYWFDMENKVFDIETQDYADGYVIKIIGMESSDEDIQYIYLIPNNDRSAYEVYSADATEASQLDIEGDDSLVGKYDDNEFNPYSKYCGTLDSEHNITLDYSGTIDANSILGFSMLDKLELNAYLIYTDKGVKLVLPDIIKLGGSGGGISTEALEVGDTEYNFTKQVTVQAIVKEKNKVYYNDSVVDSWIRTNGKVGTISHSLEETLPIEDLNSAITLSGTEDTGRYNYTLSSLSPMLYRILVTKTSGGQEELICKAYGLTAKVTDGGTTSYTGIISILADYINNTDYKVYISAANLSYDGKGISDFSDMWIITGTGLSSERADIDYDSIIGSDNDLTGSSLPLNTSPAPFTINTPSSIGTTETPATTETTTEETTETATEETTEDSDTTGTDISSSDTTQSDDSQSDVTGE